MTTEQKDYRLDGIYRQKQDGFFMQRVKLAAGSISAQQARQVALIAANYGRDAIHLTSRGNMEIHWLREHDLPEIKRLLTSVGLTSRGACGGAVRGVTCSSGDAQALPVLENLARRIQRHFTGNPRFERIPKKFKIGVEADATLRQHLIQDCGLLLTRTEDGRNWYDMWIAGGLGREPRPGFPLASDLPEERVIPLIEAILRVYIAGAGPGKRLKHLLAEIGEEELRRRIDSDPSAHEELPPQQGTTDSLHVLHGAVPDHLEAFCRAGMLTGERLVRLAEFAETWANGALRVTTNQNINFSIVPGRSQDQARVELEAIHATKPEDRITLRVCPGTHECRAGLAPTRDIGEALLSAMGPKTSKLKWALSGCHNSCTQPQLAEAGIVTSRLVTGDDGNRTPRFDLLRPAGQAFNEKTGQQLTLEELLTTIRNIG